MAIPSNPLDSVSFGDLNDEIGNNTNDTLDLIQAGLDFGFSPGSPTLGGNWTDAVAGLSISEFKGITANNGLANDADFTDIGSGYTLTLVPSPSPTGAPGGIYNRYIVTQPGTVYPFTGNPASVLTAGPHSIPIEITSDGTYVITNNTHPSGVSLNPTWGGTAEIVTQNNHILTVPALPALWTQQSDLPTYLQQPGNSNSGTVNRGPTLVYDQYFTLDPPSGPVFVLEQLGGSSLYNDKTLSQNPTPVPYNAGTYQVSTIDWKFSTYFSLTTSGPANTLPNTDTSIVTAQSVGSIGIQPSTSNFLRTEVDVTVNYNNFTTPRQTYIYGYVPGAFPGSPTSWGLEMNRNGNPSNPAFDNYYYAIPVIQDGSPATSNTLTTTPNSVTFDFNGGTSPTISINVTPNSNSYTYSLTGPGAPAFTLNSLSSPQTGDDTFSITATSNSGGTRTADLQFTHPGGTTPLPITQAGVEVEVDGYAATNSNNNKTIPFSLTSDTLPVQTTPNSIPWTATVLPSPTPFVSLPSPLSRTGDAPTFEATWPVNPSTSPRTQAVKIDFNVNGTPYYKQFTYIQGGAPNPEVLVNPGSPQSITSNGGSKSYTVTANTPFSVNFSTSTPKLTINPTQTSFTAGPTPAPYVFTINGATNPIYEVYSSTFQVSSPILPSPVSRNVTLQGNPADVVVGYNPSSAPVPQAAAAFGGNWSLIPFGPYPAGRGLSVPSSGGSVTANVKTTRLSDGALINAPVTLTYDAPNPAVITGLGIPPQSTSGNRGTPGTITLNIPSNPSPSFQKSFTIELSSPFQAVSPIWGLQAKFVPEFSIPNSQITMPEGGGNVTRGLSSNVPWSVPGNPAPWLTVSPTGGSSPTTITFSATAVGPAPRSTNVPFTSNGGGSVTIPVVQFAPEPDSFSLPTTPATIPYLGGSSPSRSLTTVPSSLPWSYTNSYPWITVSVGTPNSGPATISFSAPSNSGAYRSGGVTFNNPISPVFVPVAQPAPPVPDSLTITPTNVTLPWSIGFGETITATGTGTFYKTNNNPTSIEVSPSNPAVPPAPFTINAYNPNTSTSPITLGSVDISHPANNYTITVTQEGQPVPEPEPITCFGIPGVGRSTISAESACTAAGTKSGTHYFNGNSYITAPAYYGLSDINCGTLETTNYWVSDGNTWRRYIGGAASGPYGICSGGFG